MRQPIPQKKIQPRLKDEDSLPPELANLPPLLQRIFAARGIVSLAQLERKLAHLPSPWLLPGMEKMATSLAAAITAQQKIVVVADYDADGATSCAIAMQGLRDLGAAQPAFVVPNRFHYSYGLTPEIVKLVKQLHPDVQIILTVDNGISSVAGVEAANALGIAVLITDHHAPPTQLPQAAAIVNPVLPNSAFPSKHLAGCGVMFYVLMALRAKLREAGYFSVRPEPALTPLLDYVALGTVADVVVFDQVNRILIHQGLLRIRRGQCHAGILALIHIAGKNARHLTTADLGFALAPRLNAAGRMQDMSLGIQCLLADDPSLAYQLAQQLEQLNIERKAVEAQMKQEAMWCWQQINGVAEQPLLAGVCLYDASWHQGVIGILASRMKERLQRPVIMFAPAGTELIKGSARSIAGIHIRDVISDIATAHPRLITEFGGHAMAAGLSLKMHDYPVFALAFDDMIRQRLQGMDLQETLLTDGQLSDADFSLACAQQLQDCATWGHGFPEPVFEGVFDVVQCRILAHQHLKWVLRVPFTQVVVDGILFFVEQPDTWLQTKQIRAVYKVAINDYQDQRSLQLQLLYVEKKH